MLDAIKKLTPGVALILMASALLLALDRSHRSGHGRANASETKRIAILQNVSAAVLNDGVEGNIAGLAEAGFIHDKTAQITVFNADGDMTMLPQIATQIASDQYDMVLSVSTPGLQAMAKMNTKTKVPHVFSLVTDPYSAGVGISASNHKEHPPYLMGIGTLQPVEELFKTVRQMNPGVKRVGVVWNSSETNSEVQIKIARKLFPELGFELLEANSPTSTDVGLAAQSLVSRGAELLWAIADSTVIAGIDSLVSAAKAGNIPVVSNLPGMEKKGLLVSIGANYFEVGRKAGLIAGEILKGADPATMAVENYMPKVLTLNAVGMADYSDKSWNVPPAVEKEASIIITSTGVIDRTVKREAPPPVAVGEKPSTQPSAGTPMKSAVEEAAELPYVATTKVWSIYLVAYADTPPVDEAIHGFKEVLEKAKLVEGRDYKLTVLNAQLDVGTLSSMMDSARAANADIVVPMCTPALQAAIRKIETTPILFSVVANPFLCGAGKNSTDHKANVTGISSASAMKEMAELVHSTFPGVKRVGTVYTPAESNSVFYKEEWGKALKEQGIELTCVPVEKPTDVSEAAATLCRGDIDMVGQIVDNLTSSAFSTIAKAADKARIPVVGFASDQVKQGSLLALARDYSEMGAENALLVIKVMRGADPAKLPILPMKKTKLVVNPARALEMGFKLPESLIRRADEVVR